MLWRKKSRQEEAVDYHARFQIENHCFLHNYTMATKDNCSSLACLCDNSDVLIERIPFIMIRKTDQEEKKVFILCFRLLYNHICRIGLCNLNLIWSLSFKDHDFPNTIIHIERANCLQLFATLTSLIESDDQKQKFWNTFWWDKRRTTRYRHSKSTHWRRHELRMDFMSL